MIMAAQYLSRQVVYLSIYELQYVVVNGFRYFRKFEAALLTQKFEPPDRSEIFIETLARVDP